MNNNDIMEWKSYKVKDLFITEKNGNYLQVPTGASISARELEDGTIPRITVSNFNNGVVGYYNSKSKNFRVYNNFISVSFLGTVFYQSGDASLDMKVHCLKTKDIDLDQDIALFLVSVIRKSLDKFMYADQISSTVLPELELKLPTNEFGKPDWDYMRKFIIDNKPIVSEKYNILNSLEKCDTKIDVDKWKEFEIGYLFKDKIKKPQVYHTREVKEDNEGIPYIVRSKYNNGVKYLVQKNDDFILAPGGTISFGAENATFFYQEKPFISGRDIYYIDTRDYNKYVCLFLITCLRTITERYSYNYGLFPELLKNEKIKLPVDSFGKPNWSYMEQYIKNLPYGNLI